MTDRRGNTLLESGFYAPCLAATTAAIALAGLQTIDGVALAEGDRVLVKNQGDQTANGIYAVASGPWQRTSDAAANARFFNGMAVVVAEGAVNAGQIYICTATDDPVVIGASVLTFVAQSAVQSAQQSATSSTSMAVGTGSKVFATQAGKSFAVNQWVLIYDAVAAMLGQITAYAGGSLTVSVIATSGAGTHADWNIVLANSAAAAGLMPPLGTGNVTGPGSSVSGRIATFSDATGKVLSDSGITPGTLAGRSSLAYGDAGTASIPASALVPQSAPLPYGGPFPADNLRLTNDVTNATRDINVSPGRCRNDGDTVNLAIAAAITKRFDQAWGAGGATGSPGGACDTGTKGSSQCWHLFLIGNNGPPITSWSRTSNVVTCTAAGHPAGVGTTVRAYGMGGGADAVAAITAKTTNTFSYANSGPDVGPTAVSGVTEFTDVVASQSYSSPTIPPGWTSSRCLGSVLTDGSGNIRAFTQIGDEFLLTTPVQDLNGGTPSGLITLSVPKGVSVMARFLANYKSNTTNSYVLWYSPLTGSQTVNTPTGNVTQSVIAGGTGDNFAPVDVVTNTSGQISASSNGVGTVTSNIVTYGWRDYRRRLF